MTLFRQNKTSDLDELINTLRVEMDVDGPDSEKYKTRLGHLERLITLRAEERKTRIDPNTMALVVGNILGILIIVGYERGHVMTSKGLGFVFKNRITD